MANTDYSPSKSIAYAFPVPGTISTVTVEQTASHSGNCIIKHALNTTKTVS